jgi:hypothetical protein
MQSSEGAGMARTVGWFGVSVLCCAGALAQTPTPSGSGSGSIMRTAPADPDAPPKPWPSQSVNLTLQLPGMSHHFDRPRDAQGRVMAGRSYNEKNWGIGLQLNRPLTGDWDQWVGKASFGAMKDSLDAMGVYAGYTWQRRMLDTENYTVELGGGAFLFYRTLRFDGPHVLVPGVLPVLSITHKPWGLGLNVVAVPRCHVAGGTMPNVIYGQFTKSF